eukprot:COSAG05_NODE_834_length_7061_cov_10.700804_2_plen_488_part_00
MPTISDISESESSHHMASQPGVTPRRSIFDEEQNRFVEMAPAADDGDDDGHDDDTVYGDTSDVPESEPARQRRRTDDFDHYANACPDPTLNIIGSDPDSRPDLPPGILEESHWNPKSKYAELFLKNQANLLLKAPTVPKEVYSAMKAHPTRGWLRFENLCSRTDRRIWAQAFLQHCPADFFTETELAIFHKETDQRKALKDIKLAVHLKYRSLTGSADARKQFNSVKFEISTGAAPYFSELYDMICLCAQTIGNDVTPITVLNKIFEDIPSDVAIELYGIREEELRISDLHTCNLTDLRWLQAYQAEVTTIFDRLRKAGKPMTARKRVAACNSLNSSSDIADSSDFDFDQAARLLKDGNPRLNAMVSKAGWRNVSKKKDGNGKKKPKDPRRKPKKREKFDGDVSELLEKLKLKYTAPQWKEREELVQSGKALAVDGFPYDKLFGNDKAENGKGKMQWVCLKCGLFGHTASHCQDLKRATAWTQSAGK